MSKINDTALHKITGTLVGLAGLLHLVRAVRGMDLIIGSWHSPIWLSWVLFALAGSLSYLLWKSA